MQLLPKIAWKKITISVPRPARSLRFETLPIKIDENYISEYHLELGHFQQVQPMCFEGLNCPVQKYLRYL